MLATTLITIFTILATTARGDDTTENTENIRVWVIEKVPDYEPRYFCLDVRDGQYREGTPIQIVHCDPSNPNQRFQSYMNYPAMSSITVKDSEGTDWGLDAGENYDAFSKVTLARCPQFARASPEEQRYRFHGAPIKEGEAGQILIGADNRFCLDVPKAEFNGWTQLQIVRCRKGSLAQDFLDMDYTELVKLVD